MKIKHLLPAACILLAAAVLPSVYAGQIVLVGEDPFSSPEYAEAADSTRTAAESSLSGAESVLSETESILSGAESVLSETESILPETESGMSAAEKMPDEAESVLSAAESAPAAAEAVLPENDSIPDEAAEALSAAENIPAGMADIPSGLSLTGGWEAGEGTAVTEEAQAAFDRATGGLDGCTYEAEALLGTKTGEASEYFFLSRLTYVTATPVSHYALLHIIEDAEGNASVAGIMTVDPDSLSAD